MKRPLRLNYLAPRLKSHRFPSFRVTQQRDVHHKEYFQNPGVHPSPESPMPEFAAPERPMSRRLLRSILWASLFGTLGFACAEASKTARWVNNSPRGSQREEADMQEIKQMFRDDALVQCLEADPSWQNVQSAHNPEADPYPLVQHVDPYMSKAISGSQGIQMKFYSNPSKAMMCCVVYVGEGVEWGPRTTHAGGLASFIEDSLDWLGTRFTEVSLGKSSESTAIMANKSLQIDFLDDVPTGQLYAFWMMPAVFLGEEIADVLNVKDLRGPKLTVDELHRTVVGMLERRSSLPYEPGKSQRYARARVTYDAAPTKPATRGLIM